MRRALLAICTACGRLGFEPGASNSLDDASDVHTEPADCWAAWRVGPLVLTAPQPVSELASADTHGDPWLSRDGLALYFSRGSAAKDYFVARRADLSAPWGTPVLVADLSSAQDDTKLTFTDDGLLAIWSSNRTPATSFDLWQATRGAFAGTFDPPTRTPLAALNDGLNQYDPHLSGDGLRLYYAPDVGGNVQQVQLATRAARTDAFGPPVAVPLAHSVTADPTLSPDELVIVYTATISGVPTQMYYATRSAPAEAFGAGQLVPVYDMPVFDQDPALSYDGCELYFASLRGGAVAQLHVARVE